MRSFCLLIALALLPAMVGAVRHSNGGFPGPDAGPAERSFYGATAYPPGSTMTSSAMTRAGATEPDVSVTGHFARGAGAAERAGLDVRAAGDRRASPLPGSLVAIGLGVLGFVVIARRNQRQLWHIDSTQGEAHWI